MFLLLDVDAVCTVHVEYELVWVYELYQQNFELSKLWNMESNSTYFVELESHDHTSAFHVAALPSGPLEPSSMTTPFSSRNTAANCARILPPCHK